MLGNDYLLYGYRINFNTPELTYKSFFMLHNESVNVWSHFCGAVFFAFLIFYVLLNLQPTSLHGSDLLTRWALDFDQGRFDNVTCPALSDFRSDLSAEKCSLNSEDILDDILETKNVLDWHKSLEA